LWLAAAAVSAPSLPYNLLLMSPPSRMELDRADTGALGGAGAPERRVTFTGGEGTSAFDALPPDDEDRPSAVRARRLVYAKSGLLISPQAYAHSWSKRYWFGAALSCSAFAAMMSLLASRRDAGGRGVANF
jgi:hypothetical protein